MLKKLSAILILIAMTAALAGCGNDKDSSSKNESSATTEAITEEITGRDGNPDRSSGRVRTNRG